MSQNMKSHLPTVMPTENRPMNDDGSLNDDASRLDGVAKVTGKAKYARDMYVDHQLFVGFITCPWGAGRLKSIDQQAAKAVSGVREITMTGERAKYHGHNVGYIVAESKHALRRAMRAANPQWERESANTGIKDVIDGRPDIPREIQQKLENADHVLDATYSTEIQTHAALETHGVMADHQGDRATVYATTQGTFTVRDGIGEALDLPQSQYEVICEYVGGGFGAKFGPGKEGITCAQVARKYKRPVSLFRERDEEHLDTGCRPSSLTHVTIGFNNDGSIVGGHIQSYGGVGVGNSGGGVRFPSGRFEFNGVEKDHEDVSFNAGGPRPMRAPGYPQGAFTEELVLDEIATKARIDPIALRKRLETSDDRREMYDLGAELIGWDRRQKTGSQQSVIRKGFGIGTTHWPKFPSQSECEVVIHRDGSVRARTGTQDIGTGTRTAVAVAAADVIGIPLRYVQVDIGHSTYPEGPASGGSVTLSNTAPIMMEAAEKAKHKLLESVANRNGHDVSEYAIHDGMIMRHNEPVMEWRQACQRLTADSITGRANTSRELRNKYDREGHSHGVQFVDLDVDTETGVVTLNRVIAFQACGQAVVRKLVESQVIGGVIQGASYALFENKLLDRQTGAMVNANLEQYKVIGAGDMPHIQPIIWTKGQTGVRPLGEPPVIPTAGAIACAVYNAIGSPVRSLPITPAKVLDAVEAANGGPA